jgi:hypothetical protein
MLPIWTMDLGEQPEDFDVRRTGEGGPAKWVLVKDPTAMNGRAIEQTSTDTTHYRFPLAIYKPKSARNIEVALRFKPLSGKVDQAGGIAIRLTDPDNYYVVRANALEDNVRFYRMVKGRREQIAGVDTRVSSNEWHQLGIRAEADRFTVMFDDKTVFTATDATFDTAGKVALWTKADSVTRFDSFMMMPLDGLGDKTTE